MQIGIVCHPSIGGSGLIATQLGKGLAKLGHQVHFIAKTRPFKLNGNEENIYFHEVEGIEYPLFEGQLVTFALTAKIVEIAQQYELDIVHAHYSIPHSLCAYLANEISHHKFKTVTTIHGTDVTIVGRDKPLFPLNNFSINQSDKVTTVSRFQSDYIQTNFKINKEIEVIYNFIDSNVFTPKNKSSQIRQTLAHDDEKILMHVSNFRPVKNTSTVISAFAQVVKTVNARLVMLGSGPDIDTFKQQCAQLGIANKVTCMGNVHNVEQLLPNADCIIQPSFHESFSMAALEAMACGVPTVTSNVDGIPEVVEHGETGYLANVEDADAMAKYIIKIFQDEQLQASLGQKGRERAQTLFAWDDLVAQYLQCYQATIDAN